MSDIKKPNSSLEISEKVNGANKLEFSSIDSHSAEKDNNDASKIRDSESIQDQLIIPSNVKVNSDHHEHSSSKDNNTVSEEEEKETIRKKIMQTYKIKLSSGEKIITTAKYSKVFPFLPLVILFISIFIFFFLDEMFTFLGPRDENGVIVGFSSNGLIIWFVFLAYILFLLGLSLWGYIKFRKCIIMLTNKQIIIKDLTSLYTYDLLDIVNVSAEINILGIIFNYGTLSISRENVSFVRFSRISQVDKLVSIINRVLSFYETREIDLISKERQAKNEAFRSSMLRKLEEDKKGQLIDKLNPNYRKTTSWNQLGSDSDLNESVNLSSKESKSVIERRRRRR